MRFVDGSDEPDIFSQPPKPAWQPPDPTPEDYWNSMFDEARHTILDPKDLDGFTDGMQAVRRHVTDEDSWIALLVALEDFFRAQRP